MAGHDLEGLMKWLRRDEWTTAFASLYAEHVGPAMESLKLGPGEMGEALGDHFSIQIWGWVFEDLVTRQLEAGRNLIDDYLKRRGWKETARGKAYMMALRDSVISLYEVSGLVPGESFLARDMIRGGEPIRVSERSASRSMRPWDRLATRLLPSGDGTRMSGGLLVFDHRAADELLAALRRDAPADTTEETWTDMLAGAAPVFANAWLLDNVPRLTGRVRPKLVNDDGDELAPSTTLYPLRPDVSRRGILAALRRIEALSPDGRATWSWLDESRRAMAPAAADDRLRHSTFTEDGKVVLGSVRLADDSLWLSTNSPARMARFRALIEPAVAGLVGTPFSEIRSIDEVMAEQPTKKGRTRARGPSAEVERRIVRETLDRHYAAVLDDALPYLDGESPRAAVHSEGGRVKVVNWMKTLENHAAKAKPGEPMYGYDLTWLWERLGIAHLRQ